MAQLDFLMVEDEISTFLDHLSLLSGIIKNHKRTSPVKTRVTADFRLCAI